MVADVISKRANKQDHCGVCGGEITGSIGLTRDRECVDCRTCYTVVGHRDDGGPEYDVEMDTTPVARIRRKLRTTVWERAVYESMSGDDNETGQ